MQLRQLAQGSPWIVVPEIDRKIIELIDSSWIVDLYKEPEQVTAGQQEDQAIETTVMADGYVPQAAVNDDHVIHCAMIDQFIRFAQPAARPAATTTDPARLGAPDTAGCSTTLARQDAQYLKQHRQDIEQFAMRFTATLNQMQKQQAVQQNADDDGCLWWSHSGCCRCYPGQPAGPASDATDGVSINPSTGRRH